MNSPFECIECGFSLRKKPIECEVSVYSNSENALAENPGRAFDRPASASKLKTGVPAKVHQWGAAALGGISDWGSGAGR
jgi:hypothetical protein